MTDAELDASLGIAPVEHPPPNLTQVLGQAGQPVSSHSAADVFGPPRPHERDWLERRERDLDDLHRRIDAMPPAPELDDLQRMPAASDEPGYEPDMRHLDEQLAAYPVAQWDKEIAARVAQWEADRKAREEAVEQGSEARHWVHWLGVRCLADVPAGRPDPLLLGKLDPGGSTILYGTGDTGKGTYAAHLSAGLVREGHTILLVDYEAHPSEYARRVSSLGGPEALQRIHYVSPSAPEWQYHRGAIWTHAAALREAVAAVGATYLVIDSIAVACGATDILKPEAPAQYHAALAQIGLPALSLAHVTKGDDLRYPFGSVFWHNLARVTWSMSKVRFGTGDHAVLLTHRKGNNYARQGKVMVTITWYDDLPREVWEQPYSAKLADLIAEALQGSALTVVQVVDRLNEELDEEDPPVKTDSVRKALQRGVTAKPQRFTVDGSGDTGRWSNAGEAVPETVR